MSKVRVHVFFSGRVQGVFFRAFTLNQAIKFGLDGWVKNLSDGRVEAVFEGSRELVDAAVQACRKGPAGADVSNLEIIWEEPNGEKGFQILY